MNRKLKLLIKLWVSDLLIDLALMCAGCAPFVEPRPTPPITGQTCEDYCRAVQACEPEHAYPTCADDCRDLLRDTDAMRVSGIDVYCWAAATDCDSAARCK